MNFFIVLILAIGVQAECVETLIPGFGCKSCSSLFSHCLACHPGYYLLYSGSSVTCTQCPERCSECNKDVQNTGECLECADGYYSTSSNTLKTCNKCDEKCGTCSYQDTDCLTCGVGYYDDGTGSDGFANCVTCGGNCGKCTETEGTIECSDCKPRFFPAPGCLSECHGSCLTCSGAEADNCKTCETEYFLAEDTAAGGKCKACSEKFPQCSKCGEGEACYKCKDGYYLEGGVCNKCTQDVEGGEGIKGCAVCGEVDACIECKPEYYYSGPKACLAKEDIPHCTEFNGNTGCLGCEYGYYRYYSEVCAQCDFPCSHCNYGGTDSCRDCVEGYYFVDYIYKQECHPCATKEGNEKCATCKLDGECINCEDSFYLTDDFACVGCYDTCKTCEGVGKNKCLTCNNGFYMSKSSGSKTGECKECDESCKTCDKEGDTGCTSCRKTAYFDKSSGKCYSCTTISNCQECSGSSTCTVCKRGYYLKNGKCEGCPESTALDKCAQCSSTSVCETCNNGYYVGSEGNCKQCAPGCKKCKNKAVCIECLYGELDEEGECQETKPDGSPITEDDYLVDENGNYIGVSYSGYIFNGLVIVISLLIVI